MLPLERAVALALVPGRERFAVAARLRERCPAVVSRSGDTGCPPLETLLALVTSAPSPRDLARTLRARADAAIDRARAAGVGAIVLGDAAYPPLLAAIGDPPLVLWTRGSAGALEGPSIALVGARAATPGGVEAARWLGSCLAAVGVVVVSGLARGVDAAAHRGALETGRTVAVLGSGPDVVYPPEHDALAEQVSRQGTLVAEFPPGTPPRAHHFPLRNRLISGLCHGVVVVEAAARSGALITARCALDQGREVMAVPGPVMSGRNAGTHGLIRDGAVLVESAVHVLEAIGLPARAESRPASAGAPDSLLAAMSPGEPMDTADLAVLTGEPAGALLARLTALELAGAVERVPGGRFVRVGRPAD